MSMSIFSSVLGIAVLTALAALIVLCVLILLRLTANRRSQRDLALAQRQLQQELQAELDRSRQETVNMVNSSVRNMGELLSRSQSEAAQIQGQRLREMNREMRDALQQVAGSLGEMKSLSSGVEDLRKVLSNVKTRGILGEVQLGAILEEILAPEQYEENVAVTDGSERVEYAVRLPGDGSDVVYLPIDAKFPGDAYMNLQDAYELGDPDQVRACRDQLKRAILKAAADIRTKYVHPPWTTDFGIMFLPFEGLYAEVLRLNLTDQLQRDYRVSIAGPATLAAMLSSFRMGFRSLALSRRSDEVWETLSAVADELDKYQVVLDRSQKHLQMAQKDLDELVGPRTRQIRRRLSELTRD